MKQINYTIVDQPKPPDTAYSEIIKALELNPDKMVLIKSYDAKKQRLNLLQWLRRHEVKSLYYTRIIDRQLYLGRNNEAT